MWLKPGVIFLISPRAKARGNRGIKLNILLEEIESRFSVADKLEQTIDENIKKAETLRQSILKKAFEGKLL